MTLQVFDFEGTDGVTLSGTNISLGGTGTATFSAADAVVGSTGARFTATAANVRTARCTINSGKVQAIDVFLRTPGTPASGTYGLMTLRQAAGVIFQVEYDTSNRIGVFETAGSNRQVTGVTMANNTMFRVQILVSIGVSTNDSNYSVKIFSSGSNWTTQVGSTFTRTGVNLGTAAAATIDVGALTAVTPGLVVGADYLRVDDGKTTDFTAPPTASAPTAVAGASDLYPEVGDVVSLTSTGSTGTGTLTYAWSCTSFPAGASAPAITTPTSATATFTPTDGATPGKSAGRYTFQLVVTASGVSDTTTVTVYVHPHSADDVKVFSVTPGLWTLGGGGTGFVSAVNGGGGFMQSVANPTGQITRMVMNPYGPGSVTFFITGNWTGGALNRTVSIYMADGVTLLYTETYALTSAEVERAISLDAGDLTTASPGLNRRALVIDISDAP